MTIREALNTLDEPYKSQALNNARQWQLDFPVQHPNKEIPIIMSAIAEAFIWDQTREGHLYWSTFSFDLLKQNS